MKRNYMVVFLQIVSTALLLLLPSTPSAANIKIDCGMRYQRIEGFGAAFDGASFDGITKYYPSTRFLDDYIGDLGNSIIRYSVSSFCLDSLPLDKMEDYNNYRNNLGGPEDTLLRAIQRLQTREPNLKAMFSVWSPPAWMKSNKKINEGTLPPDKYEYFARYLYQYYRYLQDKYAITLYAISPQNELFFDEWYGSCIYTPQTYHDMMKVVKSYFKAKNCPLKFFGTEDMTNQQQRVVQYVAALQNDSATKGALDIIATHGYESGCESDGGTPLQNRALYEWAKQYNMPTWMTETSGEWYTWESLDGLPKGALDDLAKKIHIALNYGFISGWTYWHYGSAINLNDAQYITNSVFDKKYCVHKHYSKYIRPGSYHVSAFPDDQDSMLVSAYYDSAASRLIAVLINKGTIDQQVNLEIAYGKVVDHFNAWRTSNIWISSSRTEGFTPIADIAVDTASRTASFTMPARSMVTLVGNITPGHTGIPPAPPVISCTAPFDTSFNASIPCTLTVNKGVGHYSLDGGNTYSSFGMLYDNGTVVLQIKSTVTLYYYATDGDAATQVYYKNFTVKTLTDAYQQDNNGYVGFEAEGWHDSLWGKGIYSRYSWVKVPGPIYTTMMQAQPNDRHSLDSNSNGPSVNLAPRLTYKIHFVKKGVHYLWTRATGPQWYLAGYEANFQYGLDSTRLGSTNTGTGGLMIPPNYNIMPDWTPEQAALFLKLPNDYMPWCKVQFNVPDTGIHVLTIWMKNDGTMLDRFEIATDPNYRPSSYVAAPANPSNIRVTSVGVDRFSIAWDRVDRAINYKVHVKTPGNPNFSWINETTIDTNTLSFTFTNCDNNGLHAGTTFQYYVSAIGIAGESYTPLSSNPLSVTTTTGGYGGHLGFEPFPISGYPIFLTDTIPGFNYRGYTWKWNAVSGDTRVIGHQDSTGFEKACWIPGKNSWIGSEPLPGGIGSLSFEINGGGGGDSGRIDGGGIGGGIIAISVNEVEVARAHAPECWISDLQKYYLPGLNIQGNVAIKIYGTWGTSGNNNERAVIGNVTWTGYSGGAPTPPTNVTGYFGEHGIVVEWAAVSTATGYRIYKEGKYPGQKVLIDSSISTTYGDPNLSVMEPIKYWITSVNSYGESGVSDSVKVLPYHCTPDTQKGLWATYYGDNNQGANYFFGGTRYQRVDSTIDFPYLPNITTGPFGLKNYSIIWSGDVQSQDSGEYTFYFHSPHSVWRAARIWVNGENLINDWPAFRDVQDMDDSGSISLKANTRYNIIIHYYQSSEYCSTSPDGWCGFPPDLQVLWSGPSIAKQIIPKSQLSTGPFCMPPPPGIDTVVYSDVYTCSGATGTMNIIMSAQTQPGTYTLDLNNDGVFEDTALFDTLSRQFLIPFSAGQSVVNLQVRDTFNQVSNRYITTKTFAMPSSKLPVIKKVTFTDPSTCTSTDGQVTFTIANNFSGVRLAVDIDSSGNFISSSDSIRHLNDSTIVMTGFARSDSIHNPRIRNTNTDCISAPYILAHVFTVNDPYSTIDSVRFINPSSVVTADGKMIVYLAAGNPLYAPYSAHINDGKITKANIALSGDSLIISGFKVDDTVRNITVLPKNSACESNLFQVLYIFKVNCSTPMVNIPGGTYFDVVRNILLTTATAGADIYYTYDTGVFSLQSWHLYTTPFTIDSCRTLRAVAVKQGMINSGELTVVYTLKVPAPAYSPSSGQYDSSFTISVRDTLQGSSIFFRIGTGAFIPYTDGAIPRIIKRTDIQLYASRGGFLNSDTVVATYTISLLKITGGCYFDIDGNGSIDRALLYLNRKGMLLPDTVILINPFIRSEKRVIVSAAMQQGTDSQSVIIRLDQPFTFNDNTGFICDYFGRGVSPGYDTSQFTICDSVGPLITKALYYSGSLEDNTPDSLKIAFSEPVMIPQNTSLSSIFRFIPASDSESASLFALLNGNDLQLNDPAHYTILLNNHPSITPGEDSIGITADPVSVIDMNGRPAARNNRAALLQWGNQFTFKYHIGPNPFTPGVSVFRDDFKQYAHGKKYGTIILVESARPVRNGSYTIFDKIGNVISEGNLAPMASMKKLCCVWDDKP